MSRNAITLEVAAFLDSDAARALESPATHEVRRIAEHFVESSYDDLGKEPRMLDGEDLRTLLTRLLPERMAAGDPLAEHVVPVLDAFVDHLESAQVVTQLFEIRHALNESASGFLEAVRLGERAGTRGAKRQAPIVHRAQKMGRNEPCFCGSGKKFKKCHGRSA